MRAAIITALCIIFAVAIGICIFLLYKKNNVKSSKMKYGKRAKTASNDEKPANTNLRFFIYGVIVSIGMAALGIKLWALAVVRGDEYEEKAVGNVTRSYKTQAPRGRILDRNGLELVGNRATHAVLCSTNVASDKQTLRRLSNLLGIPTNVIKHRIDADSTSDLVATHVVAIDVSETAIAYISEHTNIFPGVVVESRSVRSYAGKTLGAHVLGYTGTISSEELEDQDSSIQYLSGDVVGKAGLELQYENVLQGDHGEKVVTVDAYGSVLSVEETLEPTKGSDIKVTLDINVQKVAEEALTTSIKDAKLSGFTKANGAATVCMDVETGEILAMASYPTYEPAEFIDGISNELWDLYNAESSNYPLTNRVTNGLYPAASTFKAFTGAAGFKYGFASGSKVWNCPGKWTGLGESWPKWCWKTSGHGFLNFHTGILQSCDTVFYEIAKDFNESENSENLQDYLKSFGFGSVTGLDFPNEYQGRVPDAAWKKEINEDYPEYQDWLPGDNCNLIIGQGDLLITPLQLCAAYCAIANGTSIPKPYLLHSVLDDDGNPVLETKPEIHLEPVFEETYLSNIRPALKSVVNEGTVSSVFYGMDVQAAGKTGTAEVAGKENYGLFVGYAPYKDPKYCCACIVEQGGSGAVCASPVVRSVLSAALGLESSHHQHYSIASDVVVNER